MLASNRTCPHIVRPPCPGNITWEDVTTIYNVAKTKTTRGSTSIQCVCTLCTSTIVHTAYKGFGWDQWIRTTTAQPTLSTHTPTCSHTYTLANHELESMKTNPVLNWLNLAATATERYAVFLIPCWLGGEGRGGNYQLHHLRSLEHFSLQN